MSRDERDERAEQAVTPYVGNNMIGAEEPGQQRRMAQRSGQWLVLGTSGCGGLGALPRQDTGPLSSPVGGPGSMMHPGDLRPFHYGRWAVVGGRLGLVSRGRRRENRSMRLPWWRLLAARVSVRPSE